MEKRNAKIDVDFTSAGLIYNSDVLFNLIISYNGSGKSRTTASRFIIKAFKQYNPKLKNSLLNEIENYLIAEYILNNYNINSEDDFLNFLKDFKKPSYELKTAYKRIIIINQVEPEEKKLIDQLAPLRMRERCLCIYEYVWQYALLTRNKRYLKLTTDKVLADLSSLYQSACSEEERKIAETVVKNIISHLQLSNNEITHSNIPGIIDDCTDIEHMKAVWGPTLITTKNKKR